MMRGPKKKMQDDMSQNDQSAQQSQGPQGEGRGHGDKKPKLEDVTQEVVSNEDGSVSVTVTGTGRDGESHSVEVSIADNDEGGVSITSENDQGHSRSVSITEDAEDGGVDVDITRANEEGETVTQHIELDMNDDGTISFEMLVSKEGEDDHVVERTLEVEHFLGEAGEALNVAEVVEAFLDRGPVDMTDIELTGLNNLSTGADLIIV